MKAGICCGVAVLGSVFGLCAWAGTDGVWTLGGSGTAQWAESANWAGGVVADGTDATARFDAVDVGNLHVDLGGGTRTVGHLVFGDTGLVDSDWWDLCNGTLNLSVSSGLPTIEINGVMSGIGVPAQIVGSFRKLGNQTLYVKSLPNGSVDIAAGQLCFALAAADDIHFTAQSISGSGSVRFVGQGTGYYTFRNAQYSGTLSYTGHTIVELDRGQGTWYEGVLWLEKDDVLPHATVLELNSGKIYLRSQTGGGITVAGLSGNADTVVTTDRGSWEVQKLTLNVAEGESYAYAGVIGADESGVGNNNLALTKAGKGTQILSGANTFAGPLAVSEGTLLVNNTSGSGTGAGNTLAVAPGAALGGSGTLQSSASLGAGCRLLPQGALTIADLSIREGLSYCWVQDQSTSSSVRVLGNVSLPSSATVTVTRADGAVYPPQHGVLFTWMGDNAGATDLSGWKVFSADGTCIGNSCTYDAAKKQVLFNVDYVAGTDGTWNYGGTLSAPESSWTDASRWVGGVLPAGFDAVAHFDAVDEADQYINLDAGTQAVGRLVFDDTDPYSGGDNWWGLRNGTLTPCSATGDLAIEVKNVTAYLEESCGGFLKIAGPLIKTGSGRLIERGTQDGHADVREGTLRLEERGSFAVVKLSAGTRLECELWDSMILSPSTMSISGSGDVSLSTLVNGFISVRGGQTYTGKTFIRTPPSADPGRRVYVERGDNGLPKGSVVNIEQGYLVLRSSQQVAGIEGIGYVLTDQTWSTKTLTLAVAEGETYTYGGEISATLAFVKNGGGTQVLSGVNTFSGDVAVNAGTLLVNNASSSGAGLNNTVTVAAQAALGGSGSLLCTHAQLAASSALVPGGTNAVGALTFGGDVVLGENMTYGADYAAGLVDSVAVGGALALPATLSIQLNAVGTSQLPKRIALFTASSLTGVTDFSGWHISGTGNRRYQIAVEGSAVVAQLIPQGTVVHVR